MEFWEGTFSDVQGKRRLYRQHHTGTGYHDCDRTIETIKRLEPQVVINVAAFTMVDLCEQEKEKAFAVNAQGAKNVAVGCQEIGAKCIYLSTDYVFDGKKEYTLC